MRGKRWIVFMGLVLAASLALASSLGAAERTVLLELFSSTG